MNFTIVTNSYQRDLILVERSLRASLSQNPSATSVIFIDQNAKRLKLSEDLVSNKNLQHLMVEANCVSKARNSFPIPENTDWLLFCDDDGYPAPNYIKTFLEIIAGSIVRDDNGEFYTPRHKIGGSLKNFRHTKLLMGSNFACKAQTFKRLGGFDEMFGAGSYWGSGEETDFAWKAYFAKVPMEYFPQLIVYHIKPYAGDFQHSLNKAFYYGVGKGALVAKWLFKNKKPIVLFEAVEMIIVPFLQIMMSLLLFRWKMTRIYFSTIKGRITGLIRYLNLK